MRFGSIVYGSLKSRNTDRYGSGQFHAGRSMSGKRHSHQGLDIVATAGEQIRSPIDGVITREAIPYAPFTGLVIKGTGAFAAYQVKLFYVQAYRCGSVRAGDVIGNAQDLSEQYPGITNHVHLEVRSFGTVLPPLEVYQMCF